MSTQEPARSLHDELIDAVTVTLADTSLNRDELRARIELTLDNLRSVDPALVAHELRNPLSVIETSAFILAERLSDDPRAMRHITRIRQQTEAASAIVRELLGAHRNDSFTRQSVEPEALVKEAIESLSLPANITIDIAPLAPTVRVWAEPRRIKQVIVNLIDNARAMDSSGKAIEVGLRVRDQWLDISVRDHGPGVDPEALAGLFERGSSRRPGGHGLGLFISRQIAVAHRGGLTLQSHNGSGALFTLSLPLYTEP